MKFTYLKTTPVYTQAEAFRSENLIIIFRQTKYYVYLHIIILTELVLNLLDLLEFCIGSSYPNIPEYDPTRTADRVGLVLFSFFVAGRFECKCFGFRSILSWV